MMCTFDREQLALYMNGDARVAEHEATEVHLRGCAECQGVMAQYRAAVDLLAGSLATARPARKPVRRPRWRVAAAAVATVLLLLGALQVPVVAAQVAKLYPFLAVFELDKSGVAEFLRQFNADDKQVGKVFRPELFQTVAEAEEAWGGRIPQPTSLRAGTEISRIDMFRRQSGHNDVTLYYWNQQKGQNFGVHISTRPQQRTVPGGVTSTTKVNGQKAVVISGTWGQYPGEPLKWEPDSDIHLFFSMGELYADVFTVGQGATLDELVYVAESIR